MFPAARAAQAHEEAVRLRSEGRAVLETAMSATELAELAAVPGVTVEYRDGRPSAVAAGAGGRFSLRRWLASRLGRFGPARRGA